MRFAIPTTAGTPVFRPSVIATIVYGGLFSIWVIYLACTVRIDEFSELVLGERVLGMPLLRSFLVLNLGFLAVLAVAFVLALREPEGRRRTQVTSVAFAIALVVTMQALVVAMGRAAEFLGQ
jgi:hypothetical protein